MILFGLKTISDCAYVPLVFVHFAEKDPGDGDLLGLLGLLGGFLED